jgi:hypothetical protein
LGTTHVTILLERYWSSTEQQGTERVSAMGRRYGIPSIFAPDPATHFEVRCSADLPNNIVEIIRSLPEIVITFVKCDIDEGLHLQAQNVSREWATKETNPTLGLSTTSRDETPNNPMSIANQRRNKTRQQGNVIPRARRCPPRKPKHLEVHASATAKGDLSDECWPKGSRDAPEAIKRIQFWRHDQPTNP